MGVTAKDMDPVDALETVGQFLRPPDVTQLRERIVELRVFDVVAVELSGQPLVAVDVYLDPKRKPGLQLDVNETQVAIHEVVVEL